MAKVYADLIKKRTINPKTGNPYTIEDVPNKLQDLVKELLE